MISRTIRISGPLEGAPEEIQLIPYGRHETEKGAFVLDEESVALVMEEFGRRANDVVVDYEHQSLAGVEAPAAGWITRLIDRGRDGLWGAVRWTARAKQYLSAREYRYLSPVFLKRVSDDNVVRLLNAALTNQPAIDGMVPLVNKAIKIAAHPSGARNDVIASVAKQSHETGKEEGIMLEKLIELLALKEDATEEQALEDVRALKEQALTLHGVREMLGLSPEEGAPAIRGTLMAMKRGSEEALSLGKRVAELEAALSLRAAERSVEQAMKEGKVTPAQREWAVAYAKEKPEEFMAFVAKAPVLVRTGAIDTGPLGGRPAAGLSGAQRQVNGILGISEETFRTHNN